LFDPIERHGESSRARASFAIALSAHLLIVGFTQSVDAQITLDIGEVTTQPGQTAQVPVTIQATGTPASTAVLFLQFDAEKLSVTGVTAGEAMPAGKEVQSNAGDGEVGLIAFGLGVAPLSDGVLFMVSFDTANTSGGDILTIQGAQASAAGIDATPLQVSVNNGSIAVGCSGIGTPSGIQASDDDPAGVSVSWVTVEGASEYRVYRSATDLEAEANPISGWIEGTSFFDDTAPSSTGSGMACTGDSMTASYYWVAARSPVGCESGLGGPVAGSRAVTKDMRAGHTLEDTLLLAVVLAVLAVCRRKNSNSPFLVYNTTSRTLGRSKSAKSD
jgi:hypothetical protein